MLYSVFALLGAVNRIFPQDWEVGQSIDETFSVLSITDYNPRIAVIVDKLLFDAAPLCLVENKICLRYVCSRSENQVTQSRDTAGQGEGVEGAV